MPFEEMDADRFGFIVNAFFFFFGGSVDGVSSSDEAYRTQACTLHRFQRNVVE
jgi:hypothetical protein